MNEMSNTEYVELLASKVGGEVRYSSSACRDICVIVGPVYNIGAALWNGGWSVTKLNKRRGTRTIIGQRLSFESAVRLLSRAKIGKFDE